MTFQKHSHDVKTNVEATLKQRFWNVSVPAGKTSWRCMAKTNILVLTKTSWRRKFKANIFVLIKMSSEEEETPLQEVFKTSSSSWMFARHKLPGIDSKQWWLDVLVYNHNIFIVSHYLFKYWSSYVAFWIK